jgi:hypothetical protein
MGEDQGLGEGADAGFLNAAAKMNACAPERNSENDGRPGESRGHRWRDDFEAETQRVRRTVVE